MYFYVFFFFQAEDGIRDGHVTGVQTCALPICLRALALEPNSAKAWLGKGTALQWLKRYEEAANAYGQAALRDKGMTPALLKQGSCLLELHRYEEAVPIYETVIAADPKDKAALTGL